MTGMINLGISNKHNEELFFQGASTDGIKEVDWEVKQKLIKGVLAQEAAGWRCPNCWSIAITGNLKDPTKNTEEQECGSGKIGECKECLIRIANGVKIEKTLTVEQKEKRKRDRERKVKQVYLSINQEAKEGESLPSSVIARSLLVHKALLDTNYFNLPKRSSSGRWILDKLCEAHNLKVSDYKSRRNHPSYKHFFKEMEEM